MVSKQLFPSENKTNKRAVTIKKAAAEAKSIFVNKRTITNDVMKEFLFFYPLLTSKPQLLIYK